MNTIRKNALAMLEGGPEAYAAARDKLYKAWDDDDVTAKEFWRQVFEKWVKMLGWFSDKHEDAEWITNGTAYHLYMSACMYATEGVDPRPAPPLPPEAYEE